MNVLRPWMVLASLLSFSPFSFAQQGFSNWGSGAYSAMPRCNYELRAGRDVINRQEAVDAKKRELQTRANQGNALKRRIESVRAAERAQRDAFRDVIRQNGIEGEDFNMLEFHINSPRSQCSDYGGFPRTSFNFIPPSEETESVRSPAGERSQSSNRRIRPGFQDAFFSSCQDNGVITADICDKILKNARGADPNRCEKYLTGWQKAVEDRRRIEDELMGVEDTIRDLEIQANLSNTELEEARRNADAELRQYAAEGGCVSCLLSRGEQGLQQRSPLIDILGVGASALLGYAQVSSANRIQQAQIDADAKIGFRSNGAAPMSAFGYGGAILANGLLGVLGSGIGQGAYGCSGGLNASGFPMGAAGLAGPYGAMNVNGAFGMGNPMQNALFGFPQGMYPSPPGMGAFLPGVGLNFQAGLGSQAYCPRWPCPVGGGLYGNGVGLGMNGGIGFRPGMPGMPYGMGGAMGGPYGVMGMPGAGYGQPFGAVPYGGYRPGLGGGFPQGYGPGAIGFNAGIVGGFGPGMGAYGGMGGMPGAFGIPYGGNVYGNPMMAGGPSGGFYGGINGLPGMGGYGLAGMPYGMGGYVGMGGGANMQMQAYAAQAAAQQAQAQAQYAAMAAQQAQQQQFAYQAWLNNYQAGMQQLNMLSGQMSGLQQQYAMTQAQLQASAPPMMGAYGAGGYNGLGGSAYLGIDFNLYRGYSPGYQTPGGYYGAPYGGSTMPGFAPGPPPPPGGVPGGTSPNNGTYTR